jgi:uncharacterized protein YbbC (DUF1343 family)
LRSNYLKERKILMKRILAVLVLFMTMVALFSYPAQALGAPVIRLGDEVLFSRCFHLIQGKKVGLVTNQSGVNNQGISTIDALRQNGHVTLAALYAPEHGIDGKAKAGEYVESYDHPTLGIKVHSLYGATRMPTESMLEGIDLLLYDVQDIGARTYTYISTLNYCMIAAQKYHKPIIVLDRPNPLGGMIVEGPVLEDPYQSFVGIDNMPMAHGMTVGELALFFNRKIGADLTVVPMEGYKRNMLYADTGLPWVATSPNIPDLQSVFGYMATGLGEGTGVFQADQFKWIGGKGLDAAKYAESLNRAGLPGVTFIPEQRKDAGGVRLRIDSYQTFNPARTGIYALATAFIQGNFKVPKSGDTIVMFDKVMGTNKIGQYLEQRLTPQQIEAKFAAALQQFKKEREKYLLPEYNPGISVLIEGRPLVFDVHPFIDKNSRVMVPLRGVAEALGAAVHWEPGPRTVTIKKGETSIIFLVDDTRAAINGQEVQMDTSPVIKEGRTMIPLRYTGEYLGAGVEWDSTLKTVRITVKTVAP